MNILWLGVINYEGLLWQRPQALCEELAKLGHRVVYLNPGWGNETKTINGVEAQDFASDTQECLLNGINLEYKRKVFNRLTKRLFGDKPFVIVCDAPYWYEVAHYSDARKVVFDYLDDMQEFPGFAPYKEKVLDWINRFFVEHQVVVTAPVLAKQWGRMAPVIPNGCNFKKFNQAFLPIEPRPDDLPGGKIVGYFGAILDWFDYDLCQGLAEKLGEKANLVLIGLNPFEGKVRVKPETMEKAKRLAECYNVYFLNTKPHDDLPHYLSWFDVCIIPFIDTIPLIAATNPIKAYEYLAAGKQVVATNLPECYSMPVRVRDTKSSFIADVVGKLDFPLDEQTRKDHIVDYAQFQSWAQRAHDLLLVLE